MCKDTFVRLVVAVPLFLGCTAEWNRRIDYETPFKALMPLKCERVAFLPWQDVRDQVDYSEYIKTVMPVFYLTNQETYAYLDRAEIERFGQLVDMARAYRDRRIIFYREIGMDSPEKLAEEDANHKFHDETAGIWTRKDGFERIIPRKLLAGLRAAANFEDAVWAETPREDKSARYFVTGKLFRCEIVRDYSNHGLGFLRWLFIPFGMPRYWERAELEYEIKLYHFADFNRPVWSRRITAVSPETAVYLYGGYVVDGYGHMRGHLVRAMRLAEEEALAGLSAALNMPPPAAPAPVEKKSPERVKPPPPPQIDAPPLPRQTDNVEILSAVAEHKTGGDRKIVALTVRVRGFAQLRNDDMYDIDLALDVEVRDTLGRVRDDLPRGQVATLVERQKKPFGFVKIEAQLDVSTLPPDEYVIDIVVRDRMDTKLARSSARIKTR